MPLIGRISPITLLVLASGCGSAPPPASATPENSGSAPAAAQAASPGPAASPAAPPAPASSASAADDKKAASEDKKAKEAQQLREDRAKWEDENKAEVARWTPQLHAEAKALANRIYPNAKAAIAAAAKGHYRKPGNAARDVYRHPADTMAFFGLKPSMTVLDIGPGDGWYTELLAPVLHEKGRYVATGADPNGPADERATFYAQRFKAFLDNAPEVYGKVQTVIVDSNAPKLGNDATFDMVLIMRGVHGMVNSGTLGTWLTEIHRALKPGGVLGIEEHRAPAGADPAQSAKKGYVPERWLISQAQAAGFELGGQSDINANPKDTKDYPEGVWTLPPTYRLGDKDHDKYAAIGESDRMTLRFVKAQPRRDATP
jgi:predicted methyltransferase